MSPSLAVIRHRRHTASTASPPQEEARPHRENQHSNSWHDELLSDRIHDLLQRRDGEEMRGLLARSGLPVSLELRKVQPVAGSRNEAFEALADALAQAGSPVRQLRFLGAEGEWGQSTPDAFDSATGIESVLWRTPFTRPPIDERAMAFVRQCVAHRPALRVLEIDVDLPLERLDLLHDFLATHPACERLSLSRIDLLATDPRQVKQFWQGLRSHQALRSLVVKDCLHRRAGLAHLMKSTKRRSLRLELTMGAAD